MNVEKELAKKRNSERTRKVPEDVIDRMYERLAIEYEYINEEIDKLGKIDGVDISAVDIAKVKEGDER